MIYYFNTPYGQYFTLILSSNSSKILTTEALSPHGSTGAFTAPKGPTLIGVTCFLLILEAPPPSLPQKKNIVFIVLVKCFQQLQVMQQRLKLWNVFLHNPLTGLAALCDLTSLYSDSSWENARPQLAGSFCSRYENNFDPITGINNVIYS